MSVAALIAWLVTASSGAYVLGSWVAHGGTFQRRAGSAAAGSPPAVVFGHFGLALSGLAVWVAYLIAGWAPLAWAAVVVLVPVAGLGIATLAVGLPHRLSPAAGDGPADAAGRGAGNPATASAGTVGIQLDGGGSPASTRTPVIGAGGVGAGGVSAGGVSAGRAGRASTHDARGTSARTYPPLAVVVGHGVLAVTTMILVLLAALGAVAN